MNAVGTNLAEIGLALSRQLSELTNRPNADHAAEIAVNLDGARRAVLRLRESLMQQREMSNAGVE